MKSRWTKQELDMAAQLAQELQAEETFDLDKKQSLKNSLLSRMEYVDADQVIGELQAGIDMFHRSFDAAKQKGMEALAESELDEILKEHEEEEQADILLAVLEACAEAAGRQIPDSLRESREIAELKKMLVEYLCEYSVLYLDCETSFKLTEEFGEERIHQLAKAEEESQKEIYMALAIYILKVQGRLENVPAQMSEREIGISAAAACYKEKTILEGLSGKLNWEEVKETLKLIAGTAILALLAVVTVKVAAAGGILIAVLVDAIVGMGVIGVFAGVLMGAGAAGYFINKMLQVGDKIGEKTGVNEQTEKLAKQLKTWFDETLKPACREFWEKIERMAAVWNTKEQKQTEDYAYSPEDVAEEEWEEEQEKEQEEHKEEDKEDSQEDSEHEQQEDQTETVMA